MRRYVTAQTAYTAGPRLNPGFGSIVPRTNGGDSNYHGLQTSLARSTDRLTVRGSYTWSRSIDNMSEVFVTSGGASRWQNVFDSTGDRAVSAFHRTHRGAISYSYALPFKSKIAVLDYLIGGWSTSGIISFQSGAPETIWNAMGDQNGDGETANDRPVLGNQGVNINYSSTCIAAASNCNTGVGIVGTDGIIRAYRPNTTLGTTGFVGTADQFRYLIYPTNSGVMGTVGRNSFYYPGRQDWNLSVLKRIPMKYAEGHEFEIRGDFFNAFNHPILGVSGLNGSVSSPSFLDVNSTRRGGRTIQLWAKYTF